MPHDAGPMASSTANSAIQDPQTDPSHLIATRLCHDLASPIGAISNTADLMRELAGGQPQEDVDMVARTAERAAQMLQFYRMVFGAGNGAGVDCARFIDLAACQEIPNRIGLMLGGPKTGALSAQQARIAGLLLMVARAMIGLRGEMRLILPEAEQLPSIAAKGDRVEHNLGLLDLLTEPDAKTSEPKHVEFPMLRNAVAAAGARLDIQHQTGRVVLTPLKL